MTRRAGVRPLYARQDAGRGSCQLKCSVAAHTAAARPAMRRLLTALLGDAADLSRVRQDARSGEELAQDALSVGQPRSVDAAGLGGGAFGVGEFGQRLVQHGGRGSRAVGVGGGQAGDVTPGFHRVVNLHADVVRVGHVFGEAGLASGTTHRTSSTSSTTGQCQLEPANTPPR